MVTLKQRHLIETTWSMIIPKQHLASGIFYVKLFSIDGKLRNSFPQQLLDQKRNFISAINLLVGSLDRIERIVPMFNKIVFGTKLLYSQTPMYSFGDALLYTLRTILGRDFKEEIQNAWIMLVDEIMEVSIENINNSPSLLTVS